MLESNTFCPSRRMLIGGETTEMFVAFRSSRALITVPSKMCGTMSSSTRPRAHHASQSTFPLRQARLTPRHRARTDGARWRDLADSDFEQAGERPLHPPGIGVGEINRRDRRLGYFHDRGSSGISSAHRAEAAAVQRSGRRISRRRRAYWVPLDTLHEDPSARRFTTLIHDSFPHQQCASIVSGALPV